jgi:hypothetical protein
VETEGRTLLATHGDGKVQLRDPADGSQVRVMGDDVSSVCVVGVRGRTLLATLRTWTVQLGDPADGTPLQEWKHPGVLTAVCAVETEGQTLLATVDNSNGKVRMWDPADGTQVWQGSQDDVSAVCVVAAGGQTLLATVDDANGKVQLWDPADGTPLQAWEAHAGGCIRYARWRPGTGLDSPPPAATTGRCAWWRPGAGSCLPAAALIGRCSCGIRPTGPRSRHGKLTKTGCLRCVWCRSGVGPCLPPAAASCN